jgi:hypothetical protein
MAPKAKKTQKATGATVNGKGDKPTPPTDSPTKSLPVTTGQEEGEGKATTGTGKPDQAAYQAEQDRLKSEIDALQVKLVWHLTSRSRTGSYPSFS